jgi:diphthine-ammonia ligase
MPMNRELPNGPYAVSWSGGKDSALSLWRAWSQAGPPQALLTLFVEDGSRSRSHGLRPQVVAAQADAMGVPLAMASTSWQEYEMHFIAMLRELQRERGIQAMVFGDIDLEPHREWCQRVCANVGIACVHPLWLDGREALLEEFLAAGFATRLVAVQEGKLDPRLLGRVLDAGLIEEFREAGIDLCGENGEYHSVVTGGPCFRAPVHLKAGAQVLRDGYWFLDFERE